MEKTFKDLTPEQQAVFEQIAINFDEGHDPEIVNQLIEKDMVVRYRSTPPGSKVATTHLAVPIPLHMEWCKWCSDNAPLDED